MRTNRGILLAAGLLLTTLASAQVQIKVAPTSPSASAIVDIKPPSGLSFSQAVTARDVIGDHIASDNVIAVGWSQSATVSNVSISAYITSGTSGPITAYLTSQIGAGTTISNQLATTTFTGTSGGTSQPTTIFTGLNLPVGTYYLTLANSVPSSTGSSYWYAIGSSPGPAITNSAGGVTGLFEGVSGGANYPIAPYPPASTFFSETGNQQTGTPGWDADLFDVVNVQSGVVAAATVGTPYSQTLTATGGVGSYTWTTPFVQGGNLPPAWLSIDPALGTLSGTPTANGTFTFTVRATDSQSNVGQQQITLLVNFSGTVITTNLPAGMAIVNVSGTSNTPTVGGDGGGASSGTNQSLWYQPFNTAGQLLEYTMPPGTYTMRVIDPTDAAAIFPNLTSGQLSSMWTAWTYNSPWLTDYLVFDTSATSNSGESQLFAGAGGSPGTNGPASAYVDAINGYTPVGGVFFPPYFNNITFGSRLATPQKTITFPVVGSGPENVIFAVPDSELGDNAGGVSILIAPLASQSLSITTTSLSNGQVGVAYTATQLNASGGSGIYTWTATGLPPGLTVSAAGVLSGTPTFTGSPFPVYFTVTDPVSGSSFTQQTPFNMSIGAPSPALAISPTGAPLSQGINQGEFGVTYNQPLVATGGYGTYAWRIYSGNPGPLSINPATGVLSSSTPLEGGNFSQFYVEVTDAAGDTFISPQYTLLVDGAVTISSGSLPAAAVGESWATTFTATSGTTIYIWSATGLPSWATLNTATGVISGVPTAAGTTSPISVTVTDSAHGTSTTSNLSLVVTLPVGYVVDNAVGGGNSIPSIQFVPGTGTPVSQWASGFNGALGLNGFDITEDAGGNAVVAAGTSLTRITPFGGNVLPFVNTPSGSSWVAVALDPFGNFIVGDNVKHAIWRVSADGVSAVLLQTYPVSNSALNENIRILVDVHGNYIIAEDNNSPTAGIGLFSMAPTGVPSAITLTGSPLPKGVGGMTFDANGNYMLVDYYNQKLFQITPQGAATVFASNVIEYAPYGLARNPLTNEYAFGINSGLEKISANGFSVSTLSPNGNASLDNPAGIATLTEDFPSTVDATNPLAYFRLETVSGVSEVNGAYTYAFTGGATSGSSGAPIGNPANNSALLDGSSGAITTNLTGHIATAGSMMAWVKLAVLPSASGFPFTYIAGESAQANDFDLQFNNSNVLGFYTTCCGNSISYTPDPSTLVNRWHMVVATFDATAGTRAIYWDGALVANDNCPQCSSYTNKTGTFWIGNTSLFSNFGNRFLNGAIDEVGVWNYALTAPQVYRMYASRPPSSTGFVTSLSPTSASLNAQTELQINGQGFTSNCDGPCPNVWFTSGGITSVLTPNTFGPGTIVVTLPGSLLTNAGPAEISVVNSAGVPSNALPLTVLAPPLSVNPPSGNLSQGYTNVPYSQALTASGGSGNYSWSISSESTGLNLSLTSATGAITSLSGTPTVVNTDGGLNVTVLLTDTTTNLTLSLSYFVVVSVAPLSINPNSTFQEGGTQFQPFSMQVSASGGSGNYSWSIPVSEPTGLNLSFSPTTGAVTSLAGTPTASNTDDGFSITIRLTDTTTEATLDQTYIIPVQSGQPTVPAGSQPAGTTVYVLNEVDSLIGVTGGIATSLGSSTCDYCALDMARDAAGDFIAAAGSQLARYAPNGNALAGGPVAASEGSFFRSVAIDSAGNYIVADNEVGQILKIAPGASILPPAIATFPPTGDAYVRVDSSGNYILALDNFSTNQPYRLSMYRITPPVSGVANCATLTNGCAAITITPGTGGAPASTGGLTFDAQGNYVDVDWSNEIVYTITPSGASSALYTNTNGYLSDAEGIYRDPLSGYFFLVDDENNALYTFAPDGSNFSQILTGGLLNSPSAIVVADTVAPGTVDYVLTRNAAIVPVGGGSTITCPPQTCPSGAADFAVDSSGNFIVGAISGLVKITPTGASSVISPAPSGSQWFSVAIDSSGYYIVADNKLHQVVRISPTGTVVPVASYTVSSPGNLEDAYVRIDSQGNYIVAEDNGGIHIYNISPSGTVTPLTLTGTLPGEVGGFTLDASGNYVVTDGNFNIDLITPGGAGTALFTDPGERLRQATGIYRDLSTGNFLFTDRTQGDLFSLTPDGSQLTLVANQLSSPVSVVSIQLGIVTTALPPGTQGQAYSPFTLTGIGGSGSYTWSATGLPGGMNLSTAGVLSGTPGPAGPFTVMVTLTDSASHSTTKNLSLNIAVSTAPPPPPPPAYQPLSITTSSLSGGTVGAAYGPAGLAATGGSGNYSWSVGGLPPGLSASAAGVLSGTPTAPGTFSVTASVSDSTAGMTAQASYTLSISFAALTAAGPANLGGFAPAASISAAYTASGGKTPYAWSASGLPIGLAIDPSSGKLAGSIAKPGNYNFTVQVTDAQPVSQTINVSLFVLGIATTSLPDATNKIAYTQTLAAVGGNPPPYVWSLNGTLPPGLTLSGSGVLSGTPVLSPTPTSTQTFSFGVSLASGGVAVSATLSLNVTLAPNPLSIPGAGDNPIALPNGPVQVGYSQALQAAGGIPPYSWSTIAGALPDGLSLNSGGTISGSPTRVGSFAFTAQATDTTGGRAAAGFSISVIPPALTITTASPLPAGIVGTTYPTQVFTATGGNGPYTFQTQGALPGGLTFSGGQIFGTPNNAGASSFTVTVTDSSLPPLTASSEFQIPIQPAHTDLVLSASSLAFSFNAGATSLLPETTSGSVSVASNAAQTLGYSLTVTPAVSWLDVTGAGSTPGLINVSIDPKALTLSPGVQQTSIVVTCVTPTGASQPSPCAGTSQTVNVTLKVILAPPLLAVSPSVLSFASQTSSPQPVSESLIIQNAGGGTITVNSVTSPASYVTFAGVPSTIAASGTAAIGVIVNPLGLKAGFYQSTILVSTSAGSANVPVTLFVSQNASMTLSPSGTQFQSLVGSAPGNAGGSFLVGVSSASAVTWNATVLPGANWLQLKTASGTSTSSAPGTVSFSIDPAVAATLTAQPYYGSIQVTSSGTFNSPQTFLVVLNVSTATNSIQPDPEPAGLVFIANGTAALPPQTVQVYSSSPAATSYSASSDSPWLSVATGSGTTSAASPGISIVSVNTSGLKPNVYRGTVSYQFTGQGSSSGVRAVNVTLIVEGTAAGPSDRSLAKPLQASAGCAPTQLVPTQTGLANSFAQPASWPTPLTVLLVDDCGQPVPNGQIVATFSNGDPPLQLNRTDATSGNYSGTWTPRGTSSQILINARATATGYPAATAQISGQVTPNATPLLTPNGTLNAFAPVAGAAIAPGTIVQIYGSNLAGQPGSASVVPLPNKLNSTSVLIGGLFAPLYYVSPGQINAQVPFELTAGKVYQVIVNANGALSTPNPIQLSADAPGIAGFPSGQIIAQHLDGSLVLDASPAAPGEVIVFYVAGMGATNQDITSGTASPSTNPAQPLDTPTITVDGIPVTNILFAGLTPTLVGLYQVDFQVPATASNGDLQLVLTQASGASNTTILPVHN